MYTTISSPSISGSGILFTKWKAIDGNADKTIDEFYTFISQSSLFRDIFLSENTSETFDNIKVNIVILKLTTS